MAVEPDQKDEINTSLFGQATDYNGRWNTGLTIDAQEFAREMSSERYATFIARAHNDRANVWVHEDEDGQEFYEDVQVEFNGDSGPRYLMALRDADGDWVEETQWDEEQVDELLEEYGEAARRAAVPDRVKRDPQKSSYEPLQAHGYDSLPDAVDR